MIRFSSLSLSAGLAFVLGCGGSNAPISTPSYDTDAMTTQALQDYDKNKDGSIDTTEIAACPALRFSASNLDTNKDTKISTDELKARFTAYKNGGAGAIEVNMKFTANRVPLAGATVTFTPEAFMMGIIKVATATTTAEGSLGDIKVDGKPHPGLQPGFYRISVTKDGDNSFNAKYTKPETTTIGFEAFNTGRSGGAPTEYVLTK